MKFACRLGVASLAGVTSALFVGPLARASTGDFNGDGYEDLAIGVPAKHVHSQHGTEEDGGEIVVFYGGPNGLRTGDGQRIQQETLGIPGIETREEDEFGGALSVGDFNGDTYFDLAIGAPTKGSEAITPNGQLGAVFVVFGAKSGLRVDGSAQFLQTDMLDVGSPTSLHSTDEFGFSLASGRFNADTWDDLAIGAPGHAIVDASGGLVHQVGEVWILLGSDKGLVTAFHQAWTQGSPGIPGSPEELDRFGHSLAAFDFGLGKEDDLAVGVPQEDVGKFNEAGGLVVLYGGGFTGLRSDHARFFSQATPSIKGAPLFADRWAFTLAAGDLDDDGIGDVVVGSPFETVAPAAFGGPDSEGAVWVLHGSGDAGVTTRDERYHQDSGGIDWIDGIDDSIEVGDEFGTALAVGDFDGRDGPDLAIGVLESFGLLGGSEGAVHVLYGRNGALSLQDDDFWRQDSPGIKGVAGTGDQFGAALAAGDFDGDGFEDLAIGVPRDSVSNGSTTVADCGSVTVIYGSPNGLTNRDQRLHQGLLGLPHQNETGDRFGLVLGKLR